MSVQGTFKHGILLHKVSDYYFFFQALKLSS